jgi:hypothetical protein
MLGWDVVDGSDHLLGGGTFDDWTLRAAAMTAQDLNTGVVREELARLAPDAFDLPAALAARERRAASPRVTPEPRRDEKDPSGSLEASRDAEDLPRVYIPRKQG